MFISWWDVLYLGTRAHSHIHNTLLWNQPKVRQYISNSHMNKMTSWYANAFCITGPLRGESTGHRWIPLTKSQWCSTLIFPLMLAWTSCWTNSRVTSDLRDHDAAGQGHINVMFISYGIYIYIYVVSVHWSTLRYPQYPFWNQAKGPSIYQQQSRVMWISYYSSSIKQQDQW